MSADKVREANCGQCIFWKETEEKQKIIGAPSAGVCYGVPPTPSPVSMDKHGRVLGQVNIRPVTRSTEPACGLYVDGDTARQIQAANN